MAARSSPIISEFGTDRGKLLSVGAVVGTHFPQRFRVLSENGEDHRCRDEAARSAAGKERGIRFMHELARKLAEHITGRDSGFVFRNEAGGALHQSNVLRRALHPALAEMAREKAGFHAFRRFRVTHLRKPAGA